MIIEKSVLPNLAKLTSQYDTLIEKYGLSKEFENANDFVALMQVYAGAMREVSTKLENLNAEFEYRDLVNPIHHMESRLKSFESILGKLKRRDLPLTLPSIRNNIRDIAGIRVVCNYVEDVYTVSKLLSSQPDVDTLRIKDYIANPKPNGYRSLHVICTVPVFLSDGPHVTPVEVQFRTIAMDYWASLEHELRYKNKLEDKDLARHSVTLLDCSQQLAHVEEQMQEIHHDIQQDDEEFKKAQANLPRKIDVRV